MHAIISSRRLPAAGVLLAALLGVAGCGKQTGDLSGTVKFQGKLVVVGNVSLIAADGTAHSTGITPEGKYQFTAIPVGEAKMGVNSSNPDLAARGGGRGFDSGNAGGKAAPKKSETEKANKGWFPIPDSAMDPVKSGLRTNVSTGPNAFDIDLK